MANNIDSNDTRDAIYYEELDEKIKVFKTKAGRGDKKKQYTFRTMKTESLGNQRGVIP